MHNLSICVIVAISYMMVGFFCAGIMFGYGMGTGEMKNLDRVGRLVLILVLLMLILLWPATPLVVWIVNKREERWSS